MKDENIVKKVCKELGLTQKELAEMLDIPAGTISRWASTEEMPKTAKIALELLLENKKLKEQTQILYLLKKTLETIK